LAKSTVEIVDTVEITEKVDQRKKDDANTQKFRGPDAWRDLQIQQGQSNAQ
jgi:hypothetical protein